MLFLSARKLATFGLVSILAVVSGCSGTDANKGPAVVETDSGFKVLVAGPTNGSGEARVVGELDDVEGCLGIRLGENRWVALFPSGTKVSSNGEVTLPDGPFLKVGDSIEGGGSFYEDRTPDPAPKVPDVCSGVAMILIGDLDAL